MNELTLYGFLDYFGIAVFAMSGALTAGHKRMDVFGVLVVALVTSLGGGTLRDVILDAHPVIWIGNTNFLAIGLLAALATFIFARLNWIPQKTLEVCDAIGLAFFAMAGLQKALLLGHSPEVALLMGLITGVAGGVMRDIICNEIPLIFHKEIYATAAIAGGLVYLGLTYWSVEPLWASIGAMLTTLTARLAGIFWGWSLPAFLFSEDDRSRD